MPTPAQNYRPGAMSPATPHLICRNAAAAIDFYVKAFGAQEMGRLNAPDGTIMNAMIAIEGGSIMLVDENLDYGMKGPETLGGSPVSVHVFVPDVDAFAAKAEAAGATITMPVGDQFWGDRFCMMRDPFGHHWSFATHKLDMTPGELLEASKAPFGEGMCAGEKV
ncbi:putative enzyme related to lactoylglutathione lyase [Hartmannibacter diazotrophicus]|uniref:Putative enzyme related to lactoylglutathione lyase n=1 Tax=Hartmannibacter diazotrophicus TaxID=1482074 RepID=A0A2C9DAP6_9HYPH|nr:VOC family protein [Hartmannibacter diazotrophicus]SON57336.1 putative enzyme related to lactoylglutathione lyase [Hartmannibacter diazotrophicus]